MTSGYRVKFMLCFYCHFQTYLVAQVTVERFSLKLADEINTVLKTHEF